MINIQLLELEKHKDSTKYQRVESGIYKDLNDTESNNYRVAMSFELEAGEDTQYPLEDVLDQYFVYVSAFLESADAAKVINVELGGTLANIQEVLKIVGKRVYNTDFTGADGKIYVKLNVE